MKNRLVFGIIFCVVFLFVSQPLWAQAQLSSKERVKAFYQQALVYYKKGQLDEAAQSFGQVLELDPRHKGANAYLEVKIPNRIAKLESEKSRRLLIEEKRAQQQHKKQMSLADRLLNQVEIKRNKESSVLEKALERDLKKKIKFKVKQLYAKGVRAYRVHEYNLAADLFNQVLLLDPAHKQAQSFLQKIPQQKTGSVSVGH
ncbi:MAG: tetratricopeptide repeat protein [Candidatus Omnitrophota bacterium]